MNAYQDFNKHRLTQTEKDADDKQWYKDQANLLDNYSFADNHFIGFGGVTEYKRKKVNYDLFNNIINKADFEYVCQPFGAEGGELPAQLTNRDIVSGKMKVLLGMEMKMPFSWKVVAVNPEATSRKSQEEFGRIRDFVVDEIMKPIKLQAQQEAMTQVKGRQLSQTEQQQLQQQIDAQVQSQTPDSVREYMVRDHQDPAELMAHQLLEYLSQKEKIRDKFNKGFKHSMLSGEEVYNVSIINGEPVCKVVNSLYFDYDKSPDLDFIEDGEWAVCEYRMTPAEVMSNFGSELDDEQIDNIYRFNQTNASHIYGPDFTFESDRRNEPFTVRVLHCTWKSLMKVGFLSFKDKNGEIQEKLVDENYKLMKSQGDVKIEWEWVPQAQECYRIMHDIYVYARPVPGQNKDLDNLWKCKLPYYGAAIDNLNSPTTAPMDRVKGYQYFYNIIIYRIELLMASDKGKILAANIKSIPKSAGIDMKKWHYFMEANKIAWFNPTEEGQRGDGQGITNMVKEIDMSLISDIQKYIEMAEYMEKKCGDSIGVTKQMEGSIGPNEAVTNTKQNLAQSSHIIQPYFELHNIVKGNVLEALLDTAKVAYSAKQPKVLSYVLDDLSLKMLTVKPELLELSTYGLYVSNSSKASDTKQMIDQMAQAALQSQQADLLDVIKVIRAENATEAEELLEVSIQKKQQETQSAEDAKAKQQQQLEQQQQDALERGWKHEEDMVVLKETERRKTEIQKQELYSLAYDPNKDENEDGIPDVVEVANLDLNRQHQDLEMKKFQHKQKVDNKKLELDAEKIKVQRMQKKTPPKP